MGKSWASMVNTSNPKIQCVTPPSVAGNSLGVHYWFIFCKVYMSYAE